MEQPMPTSYKVLGQLSPAATTVGTAYTVPASTSSIISSITVANTSGTSRTYRLAVVKSGGSLATANYLQYDSSLAASIGTALTLGVTLATGDTVQVYASGTGLAFNIFGVELT